MNMFQSTPACERATPESPSECVAEKFQSTPACERATQDKAAFTRRLDVSIHARV